MRFMPGEALYQVADLSAVWVVADVFEQDIGLVKSGCQGDGTHQRLSGQRPLLAQSPTSIRR
jgi:hypothetical protein